MMSYCVYILRCSDGSYYVGHTDDVEKRLVEHQRGMLSAYTRKRRPVTLFAEEFTNRNDAFERKRQLKGLVAGDEGSPN